MYYAAESDILLYKEIQGRAIATVASSDGIVQIRSKDFALWSYASSNQGLMNGTILATGDKSQATIEFSGGRIITVSPNTQISITEIDDSVDELNLTLLKGTIKTIAATQKTTNTTKIKFKVGKTEVLSQNNSDLVALNKTIGQKKAVIAIQHGSINLTSGSIDLMDKKSGALTQIDKKNKEKSSLVLTSNSEFQESRLQPSLNSKNLQELKSALLNTAAVTPDLPKKVALESIRVATISLHNGLSKNKYWKEEIVIIPQIKEPDVQIASESKDNFPVTQLAAKAIEGSMQDDFDPIEDIESIDNEIVDVSPTLPLLLESLSNIYWTTKSLKRGDVSGLGINLMPQGKNQNPREDHFVTIGKTKLPITQLIAQNGGDFKISPQVLNSQRNLKQGHFSFDITTSIGDEKNGKGARLQIVSLADYPNIPVYVDLDRIKSQKVNTNWNNSSLNLRPNYTLKLDSGANLTNLAPILKGATKLQFRDSKISSTFNQRSLFFKSNKSVAQLSANSLQTSQIQLVQKYLQSEIAVKYSQKGLVRDLTKVNSISQNDINSLKSDTAKVLIGKRLVTINKRLLLKSELSRGVVAKYGLAVFDNNAEIID